MCVCGLGFSDLHASSVASAGDVALGVIPLASLDGSWVRGIRDLHERGNLCGGRIWVHLGNQDAIARGEALHALGWVRSLGWALARVVARKLGHGFLEPG